MCAFVVYVLLLCLFAWFVCGCLFVLVGAKRFVCLAPPKTLGIFLAGSGQRSSGGLIPNRRKFKQQRPKRL